MRAGDASRPHHPKCGHEMRQSSKCSLGLEAAERFIALQARFHALGATWRPAGFKRQDADKVRDVASQVDQALTDLTLAMLDARNRVRRCPTCGARKWS